MKNEKKNSTAAVVEPTEATQASSVTMPSTYTGNVMYIKPELTSKGTEYCLVMVKSRDDKNIKDLPVAIFEAEGTFEALKLNVGDLVAFQCKNLVESDMKLEKGETICKPAVRNHDFGLQIVARKRNAAVIEEAGDIESPGILTRLAELLFGQK